MPACPHDPEPVLVMRVSRKPARRRDDDAINALQAGACDFDAVIFGLIHGTVLVADPALRAVQMIALALKPTHSLVCANEAFHVVQAILAVFPLTKTGLPSTPSKRTKMREGRPMSAPCRMVMSPGDRMF